MTTALGILRGRFGRVALLDMDTSLVNHAHHHCHLIMKTAGPDQEFIVDGDPLPLREDTAVLVNTWEQHQYVHRHPELRTEFLALYIEPSWLGGIDRIFSSCRHPGFFGRSCIVVDDTIRTLRRHLAACILEEGYDDPEEVERLIFDLTVAVVHRFADWRSLPTGAVPPEHLRDHRIRRAVRAMRESAAEAYDFDRLAELSGLSRPRFNQLFRQCTGVSPAVYGNVLRVEAAVTALAVPRVSVSAVSDDLGFSAQSNFTRFFQQHTGVLPSEFRRVVANLDPKPR